MIIAPSGLQFCFGLLILDNVAFNINKGSAYLLVIPSDLSDYKGVALVAKLGRSLIRKRSTYFSAFIIVDELLFLMAY